MTVSKQRFKGVGQRWGFAWGIKGELQRSHIKILPSVRRLLLLLKKQSSCVDRHHCCSMILSSGSASRRVTGVTIRSIERCSYKCSLRKAISKETKNSTSLERWPQVLRQICDMRRRRESHVFKPLLYIGAVPQRWSAFPTERGSSCDPIYEYLIRYRCP